MKLFFSIKNRGMTLVEVITASAILILISGIVTVALVRTFDVNRYTIEQGLNNSTLRISVGNFTKNIREARQSDAGGYLIFSGDDFDLRFFADIDDDSVTEKLHYFLEDGFFKLGISNPSGFPAEYPSSDDEVKIIGGNIMNGIDEPIFYYYDGDDLSDLENNPLSTPITPDDVSLIRLHLITNVNPDQNPRNMELETLVRPRNIDY
ncbi:MAG: hypothetical protein KAQ63_02030 [Candidatus Moranbacteria bacterium]|nr:hypothetical protein [Candidatus Moranbacteria bacterium]